MHFRGELKPSWSKRSFSETSSSGSVVCSRGYFLHAHHLDGVSSVAQRDWQATAESGLAPVLRLYAQLCTDRDRSKELGLGLDGRCQGTQRTARLDLVMRSPGEGAMTIVGADGAGEVGGGPASERVGWLAGWLAGWLVGRRVVG